MVQFKPEDRRSDQTAQNQTRLKTEWKLNLKKGKISHEAPGLSWSLQADEDPA